MYRTDGFLPEAFRNFLALLGWSPGNDDEFLRTNELIERFSLEGVSRTNGVFRPRQARMVQHAIFAEASDRGIAAGSGSGIEAQQIVERRVGRGRRAWLRWKRPRVVFTDRGFAPSTHSASARLFLVVARFFQRRIPHRPGGEGKVLERSESPGAAREIGGCASRSARVEPRRLRSRFASCRRSRRRESGIADQRLPRRDRWASSRAPALRYHGSAGPTASRWSFTQGVRVIPRPAKKAPLFFSAFFGYSSRNATTGSTRAARCAGITHAASATMTSVAAVPA